MSDLHAPGQAIARAQFRQMWSAFENGGGIADGNEVVHLMRRHHPQPISRLARSIVERRVVSFRWRSCLCIPLFQFDLSTMELDPAVPPVLLDLTSAFDDWEVALWFAQPNVWLHGRRPVDALRIDAAAVHAAARADRYVAQG